MSSLNDSRSEEWEAQINYLFAVASHEVDVFIVYT